MTTGQIIVMVLSALMVVAISIFYRKLPKKFAKAMTASLVFIFSAVLFTNYLRGQIPKLNTDTACAVFISVLITILAIVSYLVVYLIKDEEKQRKIFFYIALTIFTAAYFRSTLNIINGGGGYPAHLCRQISYAFPIIYFSPSKWVRKYVLPYFAYAAILGAFFTLFAPDNYLHNSIVNWGELDTVLTHIALLIVPIIILATKEVKPNFHHIWQYFVCFAASTLFAHICNYIDFKSSGSWGNGMYLTHPAMDGVPTWAFGLVVILITIIIILCFNFKQTCRFFRHPIREGKKAVESCKTDIKNWNENCKTKRANRKLVNAPAVAQVAAAKTQPEKKKQKIEKKETKAPIEKVKKKKAD